MPSDDQLNVKAQEMLEEEAEGEENGGKVGSGEKQRNEENMEEKEEDMEEDKKGAGEKVRQVEDRRKRSPACLMRCLKTRRLHPAQCHALC